MKQRSNSRETTRQTSRLLWLFSHGEKKKKQSKKRHLKHLLPRFYSSGLSAHRAVFIAVPRHHLSFSSG